MRWFHETWKFNLSMITILVFLIVLYIYASQRAEIECAAREGHMETVGYRTQMVKVGTTYVPQNIPIRKCIPGQATSRN